MKTYSDIDTDISTYIADNTTQNIEPADVRLVLADLNQRTVSDSVMANAGGGQDDAIELSSMYNCIVVCASDGDSVKLVTAYAGLKQVVYNDTDNLLSVFPQPGEKINGETNAEITIFPGNAFFFEAVATGKWVYLNTIVNPISS